VQYDKALYLIEDTELSRRAIGKYIEVWHYPDGRKELRLNGTAYRQNYNALIIRNNLINRIFKYYKLEDYLDAIRKDADSKYDKWVNHLTKDEFWESHKHTRV